MIRCFLGGLFVVVLGASGCMWDDPNSRLGRFWAEWSGTPVRTPDLPKGALEAATRVDSVGRRILASNKDITIQPGFSSFGVTDLVIGHQGTTNLYISDGLVKRCTDDELAAVLCAELGKMVAEARVQRTTSGLRDQPLAPRVGGDVVGDEHDPSQTLQAEQIIMQKNNPRSRGGAVLVGQNPGELAQKYLTNLNIDPNLLMKVAPLIRLAEANPKYEKSMNGSSVAPGNP